MEVFGNERKNKRMLGRVITNFDRRTQGLAASGYTDCPKALRESPVNHVCFACLVHHLGLTMDPKLETIQISTISVMARDTMMIE